MVEALKKRMIDLADSPNLVQDLLTMLTPLRLMMWFTLLNLGVGIVLAVGLFGAASSNNEFSQAAGSMGMGQYIGWLIMMTLGLSMVLFVPLRTSGLIVTPRISRYMDQVVLSGISPARYFFGRMLGVNVFALGLIVATIPYFIFALSLGGLKIGYVLGSFIALIIFANVLGICTIAFSLVQYEILTTFVVIILGTWIYFSGFFPLPPFFALITPSRLFMIPFFEAMSLTENHIPVGVGAFVINLSPYVIYFVSSLWVLLFLGCTMILGPLNCIDLPNSTFGEVIMPGDSRRRSLFRRHGHLRRKSELCFLYENSSDWVRDYEIPLRWGRNFLALIIIFLVPVVSCHIFSYEFEPSEFYTICLVSVTGVLVMAGIIFSHDYGTEKVPVRLKAFTSTAGTVSTVSFLAFIVVIICLGFFPPILRIMVEGGNWLRNEEYLGVFFRGLLVIPILLIFLLELYSHFRMTLMRRWGYGFPALMTILLILAVWFLPLLPCAIFSNLPSAIRNQYSGVAYVLAGISYISPLPYILSFVYWRPPPRDLISVAMYSLRYLGALITYVTHVGLATIFTIRAIRIHRKMRRLNS